MRTFYLKSPMRGMTRFGKNVIDYELGEIECRPLLPDEPRPSAEMLKTARVNFRDAEGNTIPDTELDKYDLEGGLRTACHNVFNLSDNLTVPR